MKTQFGLTILLLAAFVLPPHPVAAANGSINFTNPAEFSITVGEGDDYATQILNDPWDMDRIRDVPFDVAFNNISVDNGVWKSTMAGVDQANPGPEYSKVSYFFPVFGGIPGMGYWENSSPDAGFGVETSRYSLFSYRAYVGQRTRLALSWAHESRAWPNVAAQVMSEEDACRGTGGWRTYLFDMNNLALAGSDLRGSWSAGSQVFSLEVQPSYEAPAGTPFQLDWIRLANPATSPKINFRWSASGAASTDKVDIVYSTSPNGTDASSIVLDQKHLSPSQSSYQFSTALLPPGQYYFQVRLLDGTKGYCDPASIKANSAWYGPLTIQSAPQIAVTSPSMTTGEDYATTIVGNPWDMSDSADIVTPGLPYPRTQTNETFADGIFSARGIRIPGQSQSDAQFWLHLNKNQPIDPSRYRYFTIRYKVDPQPGQQLQWLIQQGWGARVIWWNSGTPFEGNKYLPYSDGWQTLKLDLLRNDNIEGKYSWTAFGPIYNLRFDPLEAMDPLIAIGGSQYSVDWVKLTAMDEVQQGERFPIRYALGNNQPNTNIKLYYDADTTPANGRELIWDQAADAPSSETYTPAAAGKFQVFLPELNKKYYPGLEPCAGNCYLWNTTQVPKGEYYVCAEAIDSLNTNYRCSESPIAIR